MAVIHLDQHCYGTHSDESQESVFMFQNNMVLLPGGNIGT